MKNKANRMSLEEMKLWSQAGRMMSGTKNHAEIIDKASALLRKRTGNAPIENADEQDGIIMPDYDELYRIEP